MTEPTTAPSPSPAPGAPGAAPAPAPSPAPAPAPAPTLVPPVVPEKYEFKFGDGVELDEPAIQLFTPVLKELGITQEAAQKLADVFVKELTRQDSVLSEHYSSQRDSWAATSKSDKDFGGANFEANTKIAQTAVAKFGSPALKEILETTGLGNHPEMVRFFWKVGQTIREDSTVNPGGENPPPKDTASLLFNHPTSKLQ